MYRCVILMQLLLFLLLTSISLVTPRRLTPPQQDAHILVSPPHSFALSFRKTGWFGNLFGQSTGNEQAVPSPESNGIASGADAEAVSTPTENVGENEVEVQTGKVSPTPYEDEGNNMVTPEPQKGTPGSVFGKSSSQDGRGKKEKQKNAFGMEKENGGNSVKGNSRILGVSTFGFILAVGAVAATIAVVAMVWVVVRRRRLREEGFEDMRRTGPGVYRTQSRDVARQVFEIGDDRA